MKKCKYVHFFRRVIITSRVSSLCYVVFYLVAFNYMMIEIDVHRVLFGAISAYLCARASFYMYVRGEEYKWLEESWNRERQSLSERLPNVE